MTDPQALLKIRRFRVVELRWESVDIFTTILRAETPEDAISFEPGQWAYLHLLNGDGTSKGRGAFSIASAPEESLERLEFGIKITGGFTQALSQAMPEDVIGVQGPFGVFTLPRTAERLVMFAGGIGITPLRSMIRSAARARTAKEIVLFYSNRFVDDAAYLEEFEALEKTWSAFHPVFLLTGNDTPSVWKGEVGRFNQDILRKHVADFFHAECLMCGPSGFMETVKTLLMAEGVDITKHLKQESFG